MIETFNIFWSSPIELRVLLLAIPVMFSWFFWREHKRKQQEKKQERLNTIRLDNRD
jgi:preprotein translocase subunit YajC